MKAKVLTVNKNLLDDKNEPGKKVELNKVTLLIDGEGVCEIWTQKAVVEGAFVDLAISVNKNYKPVVKIK